MFLDDRIVKEYHQQTYSKDLLKEVLQTKGKRYQKKIRNIKNEGRSIGEPVALPPPSPAWTAESEGTTLPF